MQQLLRDSRLAIGELIFISLCGAVWMVNPQAGVWFILIALSLFLLKVFTGIVEFNSSDWLLLVFLITTVVGYWAAYDRAAAWNKAWLIAAGILLYYSLRAQPKGNLTWVSVLFFSIGVCTSLYYFLTYDFVAAPRRIDLVNTIGRWIMSVRPQTGWTPIHPNYVAGIVAVAVPFIYYPIWKFRQDNEHIPVVFYGFMTIGLGVAFIALVMATSRGVVMAIASGVGGWVLWKMMQSEGVKRWVKSEAVFPSALIIYLLAIVVFLYLGPATSGSVFTGLYFYGTGSRAELFSRSLYLVFDYPITGGGLGAFPGLYSQYILNIPFFNVPNSHNLFLDVAIEQGVFGGLSFLILHIVSLWKVSSSIAKENVVQPFKWIVLFSLIVAIVHGMVDDYLYNGIGSILSLFLVGLSLNGEKKNNAINRRFDFRTVALIVIIWVAIGLVNLNHIRSIWYANLGAVQLSKLELDGFPKSGWAGEDIIPKLDVADKTLHSSLQFDTSNRTANQRLGMIAMLRRDFVPAVGYLSVAYKQTPNHRGIIKSLGYSYTWLGDMDIAQPLLSQTPEAQEELDVYIWWWETQGRSDLSENAAMMLDNLKNVIP